MVRAYSSVTILVLSYIFPFYSCEPFHLSSLTEFLFHCPQVCKNSGKPEKSFLFVSPASIPTLQYSTDHHVALFSHWVSRTSIYTLHLHDRVGVRCLYMYTNMAAKRYVTSWPHPLQVIYSSYSFYWQLQFFRLASCLYFHTIMLFALTWWVWADEYTYVPYVCSHLHSWVVHGDTIS